MHDRREARQGRAKLIIETVRPRRGRQNLLKLNILCLEVLSIQFQAKGIVKSKISLCWTKCRFSFTVQVLYWHFVEVVWLFIILILYLNLSPVINFRTAKQAFR